MITPADTAIPSPGTLVGDVLAASDRVRLAFLDRLAAARLGLRVELPGHDLWIVVPADEHGALVAPAGAS